MWLATGSFDGMGARMSSSIALVGPVRAHAVTREHLIVDSRVLAPTAHEAGVANLYLLSQGRLELDDGRWLDAPIGLALLESEFERPARGARWFRVRDGASIDLRVPSHMLGVRAGIARGPIALTAATHAAAESLLRAPRTEAVADLLRALADASLVTRAALDPLGATEPRFAATWAGLSSAYGLHATGLDHKGLGRLVAMPLRTLQRELHDLYASAGLADGFRSTTRWVRLRRAAVLLSAPTATIASVAAIVGYGSVDALARAFRDVALPTPGEVRALLSRG